MEGSKGSEAHFCLDSWSAIAHAYVDWQLLLIPLEQTCFVARIQVENRKGDDIIMSLLSSMATWH